MNVPGFALSIAFLIVGGIMALGYVLRLLDLLRRLLCR